MKEMIPIITVFISGLFGLIVALLTWKLANQREKRKFQIDLYLRELKEKEDLYVSMLANLEKVIRLTRSGQDYSTLLTELSLNSARANILASEKINEQLDLVSDKLYEWSSEFKKGLPTKIGESGFAMISNKDFEHRDSAKELYPELMTQITQLINDVKTELKESKKQLTE
ncbi:MAG: hypothetical protein PSV36_04495 [Algoriphagus sp.]|nr:hypothetical protein [Algoriphagus sp.]